MTLDIKGVIAILVVVGAFLLVGVPYVWHGSSPDKDVLLFAGGALMLVLGFYFGHLNGSQTALANSTVQLATLALRSSTVPAPVSPPTAPAKVTTIVEPPTAGAAA